MVRKRFKNNLWNYFVPFTVGSILVLGFAPFRHGLIPILCFSYLLHQWLQKNPYESFITGFLLGLGFFGFGVSWVFTSIYRFTSTPWVLAILLTAVLICFLACFLGLQGYLFHYSSLRKSQLFKAYLIFPATLCATEGLRSILLGGFPWLLTGTSQVNSPLASYGPWVGLYGLSWIVALQSSSLVSIFLNLKKRNSKHALLHSTFFCSIFLGSYLLKKIPLVQPIGTPLKFSLIQANIPQNVKWDTKKFQESLRSYQNITKAYLNSDLIVWPEGAISASLEKISDFLNQIEKTAKTKNTYVIVSGFTQNQGKYYNSLVRLGHTSHYVYHKRKLVIFGEYTPQWLRGSAKLLKVFDIPFSNLYSGPRIQYPFKIKDYWIGPLICYEIAYSYLVRSYLPHSHLLLVISNDAWFGDSLALEQHLQTAQAHALISGRPIAFLSNTGPTAIVSYQGDIVTQIPSFTTKTLTNTIQPYHGATPWSKIGDFPFFLTASIIIVLSTIASIHSRKVLF